MIKFVTFISFLVFCVAVSGESRLVPVTSSSAYDQPYVVDVGLSSVTLVQSQVDEQESNDIVSNETLVQQVEYNRVECFFVHLALIGAWHTVFEARAPPLVV